MKDQFFGATEEDEARPASSTLDGNEQTANCWDDAVVESFFHILKVELVHHRRYLTRDEARQPKVAQ